ncbi:MAG: LCP family protein [Chloroflexi bacterium]|nr:LCP family protein [Chloroflexota bacterium]
MQETQPYRRPRGGQAQRVRREPHRERGPVNWRRRLKIGGIVLLALIILAVALLWQRAASFNDAVSTAPAASMRLFGPFSPERVNVLLLGYSDESREGAFLTDSMNVLSIDKATDTTSIIAIPRDLWVEGVEEVPQNMKINEAFRIGYYEDGVENGAELAARAVNHVLGVTVHGWISVDFDGFAAMVNSVGGVTVNNPRAFRFTWLESDFKAGRFPRHFPAGTLDLNGGRALSYARTRYTNRPDESSDFARSVRQQRVLAALKQKIGLGEIGTLTDVLRGHLHTNLSVLDLGLLVSRLDIDRRLELSEGEVLEATSNTLGQYIFVPIGRSSPSDYAPLHRHVETQLSAPIASPSPSSPNGTPSP